MANPEHISRGRKACANCKRRKVKCSGTRPCCENCKTLGVKCVYVPYEKRVSILLSHYEQMKEEISRHRERPTPSVFYLGPPDNITKHLSDRDTKGSILPEGPLTETFETSRSAAYELMKNMTLDEAFKLVDQCHFFLNDIYFPYDIHLLKQELTEIYQATDNFSSFLQSNNTLFKPFVLICLALGKRYFGESRKILRPIFDYSFMILSSMRDLRARNDGYIIVACYTLASLYFRTICEEEEALLYSNISIQFAVHLHLQLEDIDDMRSRVMWVALGANRSLAINIGEPTPLSFRAVRCHLPTAVVGEFSYYIDLMRIMEEICNMTDPSMEHLPQVIHHLLTWNANLPHKYVLGNITDKKERRLLCSIHLGYCLSIYLSIFPIVYTLVENKKVGKEVTMNENLISVCMNAAEMTIHILNDCYKEETLAIFGILDLSELHCASLVFFTCGNILKIKPERNAELLRTSLFLMEQFAKVGNENAQKKYKDMQYLIKSYRGNEEECAEAKKNQLPAFELEPQDIMSEFDGLTDEDIGMWVEGHRDNVDLYWEEFLKSLEGNS